MQMVFAPKVRVQAFSHLHIFSMHVIMINNAFSH